MGRQALLFCALAGFALAVLPCHADSLPAEIDKFIAAKASGTLAERSDDAEFLRRVTLDFTGTIPTTPRSRGQIVRGACGRA